jgi:hypothetical protein
VEEGCVVGAERDGERVGLSREEKLAVLVDGVVCVSRGEGSRVSSRGGELG